MKWLESKCALNFFLFLFESPRAIKIDNNLAPLLEFFQGFCIHCKIQTVWDHYHHQSCRSHFSRGMAAATALSRCSMFDLRNFFSKCTNFFLCLSTPFDENLHCLLKPNLPFFRRLTFPIETQRSLATLSQTFWEEFLTQRAEFLPAAAVVFGQTCWPAIWSEPFSIPAAGLGGLHLGLDPGL